MSLQRVRKTLMVALALLLVLGAVGLIVRPATPAGPQGPSFLSVARAEAAPAAATGFPQDEAGISAYFKSANSINLADVQSTFRVVETQTADYIVGSVPVANYDATQDVHV
jgi:hypothetical protein